MGDAAEQQAAEEQLQEEGGGKSKLPFILAGLAVFLIIVIAIGFMLLSGGKTESLISEPTKEPPGYMLEFDQPFTTNLAPPDDQYLYSTDIVLELKPDPEYSESAMLQEIGVDSDSKNIRMPAILHAINGVLATKTRQEVLSVGSKENIRVEIMKKVNDILQKGEVKEVFMFSSSVN